MKLSNLFYGGVAVLAATTLLTNWNTSASDLIISEFMASNTRTLADEDGSFEDWIEIYNKSTNTINLEGWYLTDSRNDLTRWRFPSTNLSAGAYLVVFASGKDRRTPGGRLHTNFKLSNSGEYLALVEPDGRTIATEFSPTFPPQFANISYGFGQSSDYKKVVHSNSVAKILVPSNGALGLLWTEIMFDDSSWITATNGIGFDAGTREAGETYADLKNYYSFDNNNAMDYVGNTAGTLVGSPSFSEGRFGGKALNLNGSSQYISFPSLNYGSKFSISVWLKPVMKGNIMTVSANTVGGFTTAGFKFFINQYQTTNGLINFETGDGSNGAITRSLYPVDWDQWNHIVVVVDRAAGRAKIYKNGIDVTDPNANGVNSSFTTSATWEIGRMFTSGFYYQGLIDDYTIWQGELSPTQLAALYSGASPTNLFVFKPLIRTDIQSLMFSNNASVYIRFPFEIEDPTAIQTLRLRMRYDDGFAVYINGVEALSKNTPAKGVMADSVSEFSGEQGNLNWYYGYYNRSLDADGIYQPSDFIPFPSIPGSYGISNYWTGSMWDWYNGNPPWTELNNTGGHPNGSNNGNIHWAIRRWVCEAPGNIQLNIRYAKANPGCGNGTTCRVFLNGVEKFSKAIPYNDSTGFTTNVIINNVKIGDYLDLAIDPTGTDGQPTDPCDGTIFTATVEYIGADLTWDSTATINRSNILAVQFEEFDLYGMRRHLVKGYNILAIHGLNVHATNGDFFIEAELEISTATEIQENVLRYFALPTPGAPNGAGISDLGPIITDVSHSPKIPEDADDILVTAKITPSFAPVVSNTLYYRVMYGNEVAVPMVDDGTGGDSVAGDSIFTGRIPASASYIGQMVRWYILSVDALNHTSRWPILTDTNKCPIYLGTVIKNPNLTNPLPVFHWFMQNPSAADTDAGTRCSVFWDGVFYDNVYVNIHGQSSRGFPKKSYDIEFNPGYKFRYAPDQAPVSDINFMTTYPDKAHMRNILAYETYRDAGCVYHWVIPARVELNGNFWGDIHLMENGDAEYLERNGLDPNNPLYKMYNTFNSSPSHANIASGNAEKKTRKWEGNADLLALLNGVLQTGTNRTVFLYDNVDIPQMLNMLAARVVTGDMDCCHKNYYLYRDTTGTGEWQAFPWDVDLSFGRRWISSLTYWDDTMVINTTMPVGSNNGLFNALYTTPEIEQMYWRRLRTLMDEILQPPGTPTNQLKYEKRIDELTAIIAPDAALDLAKWGTWGNGSAQSTCCIQTQPQAADIIKYTYLPQRRTYLFNTMLVTSGGKIPLAQPPDVRINFGAIDFNPVSKNQNEEFIQLTNSNPFAVDISGWRLTGGIRHVFKPGTVIPSNGVLYVARDVRAFRARQVAPKGGMGLFVQGNYQGELSARGEAIILLDKNGNFVNITSYTPNPSLAQQFLRITEIMYHPASSEIGGFSDEDFEFIELKNIGNAPIPLAGIRFTNGIYFDFSTSGIQTLNPGEFILVVKNIEAFTARYGSSSRIAGAYSGSLDNNGERIVLIDANGEEILDFSYNDNWHKITDGLGFSLTIVNEFGDPDSWSNKSNWKQSSRVNGSPGSDEPPPTQIPEVLITEILSRSDNPPPFDTIELHNPNDQPVDISGWYLTDDFNTPKKFRIPDGTVIAPKGFITFDESAFNQLPGVFPSFALGADGDEVYLFSADANGNLTGFYTGFEFGGSENNVTIGRYVTSNGKAHYVAMQIPTLGTNNSEPLVGPVVISEIMYNNPPDPNLTNFGTYVELANISSSPVELRIPAATNRWRLTDGIEYEFKTNITIQPNGSILVVDFDPVNEPGKLTKFCQKYSLPTNAPIYGPFSGKLNNAKDTIKLEKPVFARDGTVIYVLVDRVDYEDTAPWNAAADGIGFSLQKVNLDKFGNEPTNWIAAAPSPCSGIQSLQLPSIVESPQPQVVFLQSNIVLAVSATGENLKYQWRLNGKNIDGATNSTYVITNAQLYHSGTYEVCVYNQTGGVSTMPVTISVVIPATILSQPKDVAVFPGESATFGVAVSSTSSVTYQWLKDGKPIPGATNAVLTVPYVTAKDDGYYTVLVTDSVGTVASVPAKLTVLLHPVFTLNPKTVNINPGGTATFTAQATSTTPVRYQWRFNGIDIPGATNNTITITNAQLEQAGIYSVVATDDNGSIESEPAELNVLVRPTIIKQPTPTNYVARVGEDVTFEVGASGLLPISYRWRQNATTVTNIILRSTNCLFTITNVQLSHAGYYDVAITNVAGMAPSISSRAYLTVYEPLTNIFVRPGSNATFNFNIKSTAATTIPANLRLIFSWYFNGTNLIPYAITNYLTITNVTYEKQGPYTVIATNANGTIVTQTAMLLIREKPVIVQSPESVAARIGDTVEFSVVAEDAEPINYRWFFNGTEIPYSNKPNLVLTNIQLSNAGEYYVIAWNDAGADTSAVAILTIQSSGDSDNDGMPDEWEIAHGLRPDYDDSAEDKDGDGMSNIAEYIAGTNPTDKNSKLAISSIKINSEDEVEIEFDAVPGKNYQIRVSTNLLNNWDVLTNILRNSSNKIIIKDSKSSNRKYYRIRVLP